MICEGSVALVNRWRNKKRIIVDEKKINMAAIWDQYRDSVELQSDVLIASKAGVGELKEIRFNVGAKVSAETPIQLKLLK